MEVTVITERDNGTPTLCPFPIVHSPIVTASLPIGLKYLSPFQKGYKARFGLAFIVGVADRFVEVVGLPGHQTDLYVPLNPTSTVVHQSYTQISHSQQTLRIKKFEKVLMVQIKVKYYSFLSIYIQFLSFSGLSHLLFLSLLIFWQLRFWLATVQVYTDICISEVTGRPECVYESDFGVEHINYLQQHMGTHTVIVSLSTRL